VTDRNSVAGMVRALVAAKATGMRLIAGCRLDLVDNVSILVWPEDRAAWSRLTRLLSVGKGRADAQRGEKGRCFLYWEDVEAHAEGLVAALAPGLDGPREAELAMMADIFGRRGHVALTHHRRPGDKLRLYETAEAPAASAFARSPPAMSSTIRPTGACCRTWSPPSGTSARSTISASAASASPTAT
jgi:error-prone DNA polymerase